MCIYHSHCPDGFGAALAVHLWAKQNNKTITFYAAHHGNPAPDVSGYDVFIVDFSYPRATLLALKEAANSLFVIDHHKTAQEDLAGLDFCIFDMEKSGAVLTWQYFFPKTDVPLLLQYIQDRDLWNWNLDNSREISSALQTITMDFDTWGYYLNDNNIEQLISKGQTILEYQQKKLQKIASSEIPLVNIAGYNVPCVNTTQLISEIGNELAKGHPFAAMYFENATDRIYSLRSSEDGIDVSAIAQLFGGGGHFHAAGFKIKKPEVELIPTNTRSEEIPA